MSSTDRKRSCALAALALLASVSLLLILKPGREGRPGVKEKPDGSPQGAGANLGSRVAGSPAASTDAPKSADSSFRRGATLAHYGNLGTMMSTIRTAQLPFAAETGAAK